MQIIKSHIRRVIAIAAVVLLTAVGFIAASAPAFAAGQQGLTLSPASSSPSIKPGATYSSSMNILNDGNNNYNVKIYTSPYHVEGADYDPKFTPLPGKTDPSKWVHLSKPDATVTGRKLINIPYTITVPAGTAPGGYYAVIFVETQPQATSAGIKPRSRVGNILYITVEGPVTKGGSVLATSLPKITTATTLPISLEVQNTGGIHFLSQSDIVVSNIFKKEVFHSSLQRYVLPQTTREISTTWKTPPIGLYKVARSASVNGNTGSVPDRWVFVIHTWVIIVIAAVIILAIAALTIPKWWSKRRRNIPPVPPVGPAPTNTPPTPPTPPAPPASPEQTTQQTTTPESENNQTPPTVPPTQE